MRCRLLSVLFAAWTLLLPLTASAITLQPFWRRYLLAEGLTEGRALVTAPDARVFVAQRDGSIRVIREKTLLPTPLLTLPTYTGGECGLLGLTLDPQFALNGRFYVFYTVQDQSGLHHRISRFTAVGDAADPASEFVLLELSPFTQPFRNGGGLRISAATDAEFVIYAGTGDQGDPLNSTLFTTTAGKILRIAPDGSVPPANALRNHGNPLIRYVVGYGVRDARSFDQYLAPGVLGGGTFVEGGAQLEEINRLAAPQVLADYGAPLLEGPGSSGAELPLYHYPHQDPASIAGCAITSFLTYDPRPNGNGSAPAPYTGTFFADACTPAIFGLSPSVSFRAYVFASDLESPIRALTEREGEILALAADGRLWRYRYANDAFASWVFAAHAPLQPSTLAPNFDENRDGYTQLQEYAFNLNPFRATTQPVTRPLLVDVGGVLYQALEFRRSSERFDFGLQVEISANLQTWSSGPGVTTTFSQTVDAEEIRVVERAVVPFDPSDPQAMRVRLVLSPTPTVPPFTPTPIIWTPLPTPQPTVTPTPTPTLVAPTGTPSPTPTSTPTPTLAPPTATPSPTRTPTGTPTPIPDWAGAPGASLTPTPAPTIGVTPSRQAAKG